MASKFAECVGDRVGGDCVCVGALQATLDLSTLGRDRNIRPTSDASPTPPSPAKSPSRTTRRKGQPSNEALLFEPISLPDKFCRDLSPTKNRAPPRLPAAESSLLSTPGSAKEGGGVNSELQSLKEVPFITTTGRVLDTC